METLKHVFESHPELRAEHEMCITAAEVQGRNAATSNIMALLNDSGARLSDELLDAIKNGLSPQAYAEKVAAVYHVPPKNNSAEIGGISAAREPWQDADFKPHAVREQAAAILKGGK